MKNQTKKYGTTVYIGNLNYKEDNRSIKKLFSKYGKVHAINILKKPGTEKNKGIAFVLMPNKDEAKTAIENLNGKEIGGRTLKVSIAKERELQKVSNKEKKKVVEDEKDLFIKPKKVKKGLQSLFSYLGK